MQLSKLIEIVTGIIIYLVLLFFFCYFYMLDQMNDFLKGRSTVTFRLEETARIEPPTVTICPKPPLKKAVAIQYDFEDSDHLFLKDVPNVTFEDRFQNLSYLLNQDYQIVLVEKQLKVGLFEGQVKIKSRAFEVIAIQTYHHGTCYKIQPNFELTKVPFALRFEIRTLKSTLGQKSTFYPEITENLMFEKCEKCGSEIVNFLKNEALKL